MEHFHGMYSGFFYLYLFYSKIHSEIKFSFSISLALPNACIIETASQKTNSSSKL